MNLTDVGTKLDKVSDLYLWPECVCVCVSVVSDAICIASLIWIHTSPFCLPYYT